MSNMHSRELSAASDISLEETTQGLCINFYNHTRRGRTNEAESEPEVTTANGVLRGGDLAAQSQPPLLPKDHSPNFIQKPPETPDEPPLPLIEKLLEENYRGQAETFVRKSSQASVRTLSFSQTSSHSPSTVSSRRKNGLLDRPASVYTPTRQSSKAEGENSNQLLQRHLSLRTPSGANRVIVEPFRVQSGSNRKNNRSGFSPDVPTSSPHTTYGHLVYTVPRIPTRQLSISKGSNRSSVQTRGPFYFTSQERRAIAELVHANSRHCERHANCTDCHNLEYAYFENKAMPTSMPPEERQKIINNNRSLRNIKNELENLAENGAISDAAYDAIMQVLPTESSLNGAAPSRSSATSPSPAPTAAFSNLSVNNDHPPPAYNNPTPPSLPGRTPSKPEISRATALYRYAEAGDCNFEVGDQIAVYQHMNPDWWLGKNLRTGQEGVFPVNYVQAQANQGRPGGNLSPQGEYYGNEKTNGYGGGYTAQQGPPPPGPSNPYNSAVPPMQISAQPVESKPGKGQEMGKKFGKKLGNAAIFGAGASLGGKVVNSIF